MRYIIILKDDKPFITKWFEKENHFNSEIISMVIDIALGMYTIDGETWIEMEVDHL